MTDTDGSTSDPLIRRLRGLRTPASDARSDALFDVVFDRWLITGSALGPVLVAYTRDGVTFLRTTDSLPREEFLEGCRRRFGRPLRPADEVPAALEHALAGHPEALPALDLRGLSDFERDVLAATRTIPAGQTRPYAWVAAEVGRPRAVRAAGSALARNPVPLLIPCHRVVRSDGTAGQYIFGAERKQQLLRSETASLDRRDRQ